MTLRIGIDGYNLAMPAGTGVATYGYTLAETLRGMGHEVTGLFGLTVGSQQELREILFFDQLQRPPRKRRSRRWPQRLWDAVRPAGLMALRDVPITGLVEKGAFENRLPVFNKIVSSGELFEAAHEHFARFGRFTTVHMDNPPEIMHWTYPVPVRLRGAKNIYTLHDMVPLRLPYTTLDEKKVYYRLIAECARAADHLCTVSEASRDDIVSRFPAVADRLSVTYQSSPLPPDILDSDPEADAKMIEGIFGLQHRGYFLYFGAIEPKKNIGRLIEAYLTTQTRTPLVIVGARAWESEQELKLLGGSELGTGYGQHLTDRIIRLDYLPRRLLMRLVRGARAVTFPSLYEGFGLPVHEAMLLGTPVLSSLTSSLPEVAGDAAILVDPYDVEGIANALRRLDTDDNLRTELSRRSVAQADRFHTKFYESKLSAMYADVLSGRSAPRHTPHPARNQETVL
jgi:glycosyltransferase involved in cell wall biosynthesis